MSLKRRVMDGLTEAMTTWAFPPEMEFPESGPIFVLRNNDIGDLLIITPLFQALKERFPDRRIFCGVGDWNLPILENNPFVEPFLCRAPWHNGKNTRANPGSLLGLFDALKFILFSSDARRLTRKKASVGVDILGSHYGAMLFMRAGIPWRVGVKGYAGGWQAMSSWVDFGDAVHVCDNALAMARKMGVYSFPSRRPQLFLTKKEIEAGEAVWETRKLPGKATRLIVAPGGGFPGKCWPKERFSKLLKTLPPSLKIAAVGNAGERALCQEVADFHEKASNMAGKLSLRELFALCATGDAVICNSSMMMHVAAAFSKPCLVLLGPSFPSAHDHFAQWGHPETLMLGPEGGDAPTSVEEAAAAARTYLGLM